MGMGIRRLGQFGKTKSKYPKSCAGHTKSNLGSSALHLTSNKALFKCQDHQRIELYLFYGYWGIRTINFWGTGTKYHKSCAGTHGLQLHIPHQMSPYSSVKTVSGSSYACFTGIWALGQYRETGNQCCHFLRIFHFHYLDIWSFKFDLQNECSELFCSSGSSDIAK